MKTDNAYDLVAQTTLCVCMNLVNLVVQSMRQSQRLITQNLCINEEVTRLRSLSLINDRCLELQKNKKKGIRTSCETRCLAHLVWLCRYQQPEEGRWTVQGEEEESC